MARIPLYRLQGHGDHFYTTSATERDAAIATYGYESEGIACYVPDGPDGPDVPVVPPGEVIMVPSPVELRDRFAMSALAAIVHGRYHAGHYTGDTALDVELAYIMADRMMLTR